MGTIECPVCTLYLRADMNLEDHLETHPKEKVIKALVLMTAKTSRSESPSQVAKASSSSASPVMELVPRSRTPPNALMYHSSGYEGNQQATLPPPPPPTPIVTNAMPATIAVVKASDMGYPINNVMIVKSCSTKFVHQMPPGNSGSSSATASYTGSIDGRGIFIEHDRGGGSNSGGGSGGFNTAATSSTNRRHLAPSVYPRYTNERYSGPPPPYSTAISSTVSAGSQLQQSSITGFTSKYEQKHATQPAFYPNPPPVPPPPPPPPIVQTPTITIAHQMYQTAPPPPPPSTMQHPFQTHNHQQQQQQFNAPSPNYRSPNFLQAQYTEKEDGNFVVTENPKKVVEYTENDEGDFMVIEKIVKSPPRIVQIGTETESTPSTSKQAMAEDDTKYQDRIPHEQEEEYEMILDDEFPSQQRIEDKEQSTSPSNTIEIIENEDGTFDDNQGSFGIKEMPKPMLIDTIGSGKKCNRFNLIVESSSVSAGTTPNSLNTPRKKATSGLKVLSNVKVTTDLSQGIKDIILNLNCKSKTVCSSVNSGSSVGVDSINTSLISGVNPTAVVNNNCQNELIINSGTNMPPIDLTNVNDIEIINDDEEGAPVGEEEECYTGSMEVKATSAENNLSVDKKSLEGNSSTQNVNSTSRATPSVITSVIRMTPHPSPVVTLSPTPPQPTQTAVASMEVAEAPTEREKTPTKLDSGDTSPSNSTAYQCTPKIAAPTPTRKIPPQGSINCTGSIFNKPPKKLTVKLKTPLPAPPQTPPLVPMASLDVSDSKDISMVVPKLEHVFSCDSKESNKQAQEHHNSPHQQNTSAEIQADTTTHDSKAHLHLSLPGSNDEHKQIDTLDSKVESSAVLLPNTPESKPLAKLFSAESVPSLITTKVEHDSHVSETIFYTQISTHCSEGSSTNSAIDLQHSSSITQITVPASPKDNTQPTSSTTTTTTTEVEYYNITFIDDEATAAMNNNQQISESTEVVAAHEIVSQQNAIENSNSNCATNVVKPELEVDQKSNIVDSYDIKLDKAGDCSDSSAPPLVEDKQDCTSPAATKLELSEQDLKSRIKLEHVEIVGKNELDEIVTSAVASGKKLEHKIAKIEPTSTVTSASVCSTNGDSNLPKDQKDFLEAGPSRASTIDDRSPNVPPSSNSNNNASTFLEYSAEYDDYVPVSGYGMPQEQIPLSWVQKFSPQYTPFDDQNSYMDLDMCSSKTNSNSVGDTSATSASVSGSSGSRIETSMDRAPSAESLNIRTDEKMPAKGEISEQESNGDMELSWNRLYPVHENIPIYPSSYDLSTAQECWNLSNRNAGSLNNNSNSSISNNNSLNGQLSTAPLAASHHHHIHSHQQQHHHESHTAHSINFQFPTHEHHLTIDQVDDKSKIHLDYGAGSSSGLNHLALGGISDGLPQSDGTKLSKVRTYRCTECPKSFAQLKQRRAHMLAEHEIDNKSNVMLATQPSATTTSGVTSTVTSAGAAALGFFSNNNNSGPGEGCSSSSTALLNKKIKIEPQPMLMSYSSLKQELEQKLEIGGAMGISLAGPSGVLASSSCGNGTEIRRKRTYVCGTCKTEFDRFKLFNAHLMTHPAECYTCGRSFKHWPNFALHIKRHLGIKDHQCRLCDKKFVIKQKLIEHMRVHTGKAPIKCPDCDQHFRRFSNLAQHRNRHHLNKVPSKKDFVCHCGEVFQSKAKMEWHKEIHENKPKSCPFCREKFIHKNSLTRHIRLSHTEKYVKLETATEMCTICNQPYIKTSMKRHMETHTDERMAYSCTICNKLFSTNWNLKQHKWTHANPTLKPFQCNMCSSGFVREADYITHMNAHRSIRPYTCNHCGCQFIRKYNWIRHTREHEMDKNYTCEICSRKFHRKYYLTEHKRIHTGERPFSCNICGKTSSTKTNHNKHIKIHHARDPLTAEG